MLWWVVSYDLRETSPFGQLIFVHCLFLEVSDVSVSRLRQSVVLLLTRQFGLAI